MSWRSEGSKHAFALRVSASAGPGASTHVDQSGACQLDPGGPRVSAYYSSLPSKRITLSKKLMEAERVHNKETCVTAFVLAQVWNRERFFFEQLAAFPVAMHRQKPKSIKSNNA